MVESSKSDISQEDGESREIKLTQTDTKSTQESTISNEDRQHISV